MCILPCDSQIILLSKPISPSLLYSIRLRVKHPHLATYNQWTAILCDVDAIQIFIIMGSFYAVINDSMMNCHGKVTMGKHASFCCCTATTFSHFASVEEQGPKSFIPLSQSSFLLNRDWVFDSLTCFLSDSRSVTEQQLAKPWRDPMRITSDAELVCTLNIPLHTHLLAGNWLYNNLKCRLPTIEAYVDSLSFTIDGKTTSIKRSTPFLFRSCLYSLRRPHVLVFNMGSRNHTQAW